MLNCSSKSLKIQNVLYNLFQYFITFAQPTRRKVLPKVQQTSCISQTLQSTNAQWSPTANGQLWTTQPHILQQVMASIGQEKPSHSPVQLVTPLPSHLSPNKRLESANMSSIALNSEGSPPGVENLHNVPSLFMKCPDKKGKVNQRANLSSVSSEHQSPLAEPSIMQPDVWLPQSHSAKATNGTFDKEKKRITPIAFAAHHSEFYKRENEAEKQLRKLKFCEVSDADVMVQGLWAHKCSSRFCVRSVSKTMSSSDNSDKDPLSEDSQTEETKSNSHGDDIGYKQSPSSATSGNNSRFDSSKANSDTICGSKQHKVDKSQVTDHSDCYGHHLPQSKPRSCDNLSSRSSSVDACNLDFATQISDFHHCCHKVVCEPKRHAAACKGGDEEYNCLNIQVSPKRYYSLGSLCDVSICGRSHFDISPDEPVVADGNGSHSSVEYASYNDTGYTSTEEIETESVSKTNMPDSVSYDGDSEYDSEEGLLAFADDMAVRPPVSISEPFSIDEYAMTEWKSETAVAQTVRKVGVI